MVDALEDEASKYQAHGQYAEAAENYARVAAAYLDDNVLIYARYCHEAFRMWLKAKNVEKALQQAQAAFRVLDDTGWLKKSMEQVLDLKLMIDELKAAGYSAEAELFAQRLNEKLGEFGLMLKPVPGDHKPTNCPACGAPLPYAKPGNEIMCSYCGFVIHAN
jgi:primosomal protein N'